MGRSRGRHKIHGTKPACGTHREQERPRSSVLPVRHANDGEQTSEKRSKQPAAFECNKRHGRQVLEQKTNQQVQDSGSLRIRRDREQDGSSGGSHPSDTIELQRTGMMFQQFLSKAQEEVSGK